ncbi:MAG: sugar phosphate isomerase/epimerase [Quadrisphaera sp.]
MTPETSTTTTSAAAPQVSPRLSLNSATVKRAGLPRVFEVAGEAGIGAVGLWREEVAEVGLDVAVKQLASSGLRFSSLCRGGFFTMPEGPERRAALDDNRRAIDECAALAAAGAPGSAAVLVLVVGGMPAGSKDLPAARAAVADALAELAPYALEAGVTLAVEPLHPIHCADRAVVSTLEQALDLAAPFDPRAVGVVVDTYHLWWDPRVAEGIARAGREGRIASFQLADAMVPIASDVLLNRHLPGHGVVDLAPLVEAVAATGYTGDVEVEVFNADVWASDPLEVARATATSVRHLAL